MIDFTTLQGLTIPEGVVTQITDENGRVIWAVQSGEPIVLEVEKITSDTYAGETTYTGEQFILLNIFPKTNGTVNVTYGGLTKTITDTSGAELPNAQQVFFGTFNGVTDSVATPASGALTIEGDYYRFAVGNFSKQTNNKTSTTYCGCITSIAEWGGLTEITASAFRDCTNLTSVDIPNGVERVHLWAFFDCTALTRVSVHSANCVLVSPNSIFSGCAALINIDIDSENIYHSSDNGILFNKNKTELLVYPRGKTDTTQYTIPSSVTHIGTYAFDENHIITSYTIPPSVTNIGTEAFSMPLNAGGMRRTIYFLGTIPPTLPTDTGGAVLWPFGASETNFVVPKGCGDAYRSAGYVREGYSDNITEAS